MKKQANIWTNGRANLFQRFSELTGMADVQDQPPSVSQWWDIQLIESANGELLAVMNIHQEVNLNDIPWIREVISCCCNEDMTLEVFAYLGKKDTGLQILQAIQHFNFYIDIIHLEAEQPWGTVMTQHFISKLRGYIRRTEEDYIRIDAISKWIQEMTPSHQQTLLDYIMKYHSNKW